MDNWNAELYDKQHDFVSRYGESLLDMVDTGAGQRIWDLGCGTGTLTAKLAQGGAQVMGSDLSPEMIAEAKKNFSPLDFQVLDALNAPFQEAFDTVFSNAVFHWIPNQRQLLERIHNALRPSGRLIVEMGAQGNIRCIEQAFSVALDRLGRVYQSGFFFPSAEEYSRFLNEAGFRIDYIHDFDRPTKLSEGSLGLRNWMIQFFADDLKMLTQQEREQVLTEAEEYLRTSLWHDPDWIADYRRLRFIASK